MERTIKFRGKDFSTGEWHHGSLIKGKSGKGLDVAFIVPGLPCAMEPGDLWTARMYRVNPETVGQFTGYTDRQEMEIYEGDMVQHEGSTFMGDVRWNSRGYFYINEPRRFMPQEEPDCTPIGNMIEKTPFIVIGNIHDNPKLLQPTD